MIRVVGLPLRETGHYIVLEHATETDRFWLVGHPDLRWEPSDADRERMVEFS